MIKTLKFNTKDQNVWFVSDLHYNHSPKWPVPIWKQRGFNSVEESNVYTISKINEFVNHNDILFSLGDLTLNCEEEKFESFINQINCRNIYCLFGNHPNPMATIYKRECLNYFRKITNNPHSLEEYQLYKDLEIYPFRYKNLIFIGNTAQIIVDNQLINLSHFPYRIFDKMGKNAWGLSGHSHGTDKDRLPNSKNQKALDLSWDIYLKPLSFKDIQKIMQYKEFIQLDHHNQKTN